MYTILYQTCQNTCKNYNYNFRNEWMILCRFIQHMIHLLFIFCLFLKNLYYFSPYTLFFLFGFLFHIRIFKRSTLQFT